MPDIDDVFAYDTVKEVRVLDRRLGIIFWTVFTMIVFYIVIYVLMIKKQYLETEKTTGWVITKMVNPGHDELNVPFDHYDSETNPGEQGAAFVPTRIVITRGQADGGFCESPIHLCSSNEDCDIGNDDLQKPQCSNGRCMRRQWCPAEELGKPQTTESLINSDNYEIQFSSQLHYHKFALDVSTTDEEVHRYPHPRANTYMVKDILRMAGLTSADLQKLGAIVQVGLTFSCDLDSELCSSEVQAYNVDTVAGFNFRKDFYYEEGGTPKRDTFHYYGIRIMASAVGIGKKTSFANIVLQMSSAIALMASAQLAADMVLLYIVPERRHYKEKKILETEDFNRDEDN